MVGWLVTQTCTHARALIMTLTLLVPGANVVLATRASAVVVCSTDVVVSVTEIMGLVTAHGLASEHNFCFLSEATNSLEIKEVMFEERSEGVPAKIAVM